MKNLTLQSVSVVDLDLGPAAADDDLISHFCLDSTEGLLYAVTRSGLVLCLAQGGKKLLWSTPLFEEPPPIFSPAGSSSSSSSPAELVVSFSFVLELDAVFIACSSGELLLLHTASRSVEEVGVVSGGVAAAGWSPDGELLVLLGYNQGLLMMNKEWDVLAEVTVPRPTAAAAAGDDTGARPLLLSATLTWRGDSKYFATNTLWTTPSSSSSACRLLHIWDREDCQLHATAAAAGLAAPIAWQPNSRHLYAAAAVAQDLQQQAAATAGFDARGQPLKAAPHQQPGVPSWPAVEAAAAAAGGGSNPQQQQQQQQASSVVDAAGGSWLQHVLLYERNGLQHGGFDVPTYSQTDSSSSSSSSSGLVIHALSWSSDSELLAVVLAPAGAGRQRAAGAAAGADSSSSDTHEWHVQLWNRSNWHWYLKHETLTSLPDAAGCLSVAWDEALPGRLHVVAGSGSYSVLDVGWEVAVSARGSTAVIDGHTLLITPLRHGQVPPPMAAVRAVLPRPANAVAWLDGDVAADLDASADTLAAAAAAQGGVGVVQQGLCEVLAVLLSDGSLVFLRAVESDLWEETLEDQAALGGPGGYLLPLGYCPAASATGSTIGSTTGSTAAGNGFLSMPAGPWNPLDGSSTSSAPTSRPGQQQQAQQAHQQQQQRLLPQKPPAAAAEPAIPLAEGRLVLGLVWMGRSSLLLLAAPYPAEEGLEAGEGTVLIEVSVQIPAELSLTTAAAAAACYQAGAEPETAVTRVSYAGAAVIAAAPHPAGGALLQLHGGPAVYYSTAGQLLQLQGPAALGAPCRTLKVLPDAPAGAGTAAAGSARLNLAAGSGTAGNRPSGSSSSSSQRAASVASVAPVLGLTQHGALYWGAKLLANDVTSFVVRGGGPGGPALLYVTRQALLFVVMVGQLPSYVHTLPDESTAAVTYRPSEYPGDLRAAMAMAMRPGGAAAAARDPHVRAVEPGAMLLAAPWGDVGVILQMQRGNLEGVSPRLLVLAAICDALEQQQYSKAWQLAVTHRVDLNLLVDYAWPRVVQNAAQLVAAVRDSSDLCDLLFALQPGSVLQQGAVYGNLHQMLGWQQQQQQQQQQAATIPAGLASLAASQAAGASADADSAAAAAAAAALDAGNKVSAVCAAVRQAVLQLPGRYLQGHLKTVAISYAKSDPPSLESALIAIREVKEASVSSSTAAAAAAAPAAADSAAAAVAAAVSVTPQEAACPAELSSAADAALKHLLLYVDVDQLYRTALGLYDLSLAFMVVGHSQKDPGEYLSELTAFGSQSDVSLRCHAIDLSLGRYDKALAHLVAAGPAHFDAALKLAKERGLLRQLLALTQQQQQGEAAGGSTQQQQQQQQQQRRLVAVLAAYGDSLLDGRKPEDAAVAYSAAGLTEQALGAYKAANAWRMVMVLSARLQHNQQQQQALARELAEQLQASGSGADAAQLLVQYLGDVDGAVAALVAAKEWREALRVAYAGDRQDLADTTVVPGAAQASAVLLEEATESTERIAKYTARLKEVRSRRIAMEAALAAADAEAAGAAGAADNDDLASDAGVSLISGLSVYTERTGAGMTGFGSSIASSSRAASTIGGRKPLRHEKKNAGKQKSGKIRAGSPGEEAALREHLGTLAPPKHALEEAGQLAELLVMLQHVDDAAKLQQRVGQWQAAAAAAMEEVAKGQQQQQQQQQGAAAGAAGVQQQRPAAAGAAAAAGSAAAAAAAAQEVRWKWDVLRDHK